MKTVGNKMNEIIEHDVNTILNSSVPWKKLEGKTILITGGSGMIASYLVYTLLYLNKKLTKKCKIFVLVRNKIKAKKVFKNFLNDPSLELIYQDVIEKIKIKTKINYIIHGASPADPTKYKNNPIETILPNIIGTKNLLEISLHKNFNGFLFLSSGAIYGDLNKNITENNYGFLNPLDARSCYAESKKMGENMCSSWYYEKKVPIKIARIFHTYGPTMNLNDGRVFSSLVSNVIKNNNLKIYSDGKAIRPFCYITDTISALFIILLNGKNGDAYNVSNPSQAVSVNQLVKTIKNIYPEKKLKIIRNNKLKRNQRHDDTAIQKPDISKIQKLGWTHNVSISNGFKRTIDSFFENKIKQKMINVAILGATGHIGQNVIHNFSKENNYKLFLFSRKIKKLEENIAQYKIRQNLLIKKYSEFNDFKYNIIINCVGISDPKKIESSDGKILEITEEFDSMTLNYLKNYPETKLINFSSGIVYGRKYDFPIIEKNQNTKKFKNMESEYFLSKINSEKKHRKLKHLNIIDFRLFSFFSRYMNLNFKFFMSEVVKSLIENKILITNELNFYRDYIHPKDLHLLIKKCMEKKSINIAFDLYSRKPIEKFELLNYLKSNNDLKFKIKSKPNDSKSKNNYYSKSKKAQMLGYKPRYSSLDTILDELQYFLKN